MDAFGYFGVENKNLVTKNNKSSYCYEQKLFGCNEKNIKKFWI